MIWGGPKKITDNGELDGEEPRDGEYSSMNLNNLMYSTELFDRNLAKCGTANSKVSGRRGPTGKPTLPGGCVQDLKRLVPKLVSAVTSEISALGIEKGAQNLV
jgi:hypothetical protein